MDQPHNRDPLAGPNRESATEPVLRSRLLPRVSFQTMLLFTTVCGILIAIVYAADQGGIYATGAAAGLLFLVGMSVLSAMVFLLSWSVSFIPSLVGYPLIGVGLFLLAVRLMGITDSSQGFLGSGTWLFNYQLIGWYLVLVRPGTHRDEAAASPFADDQLPPQILAPREPTT